MRTKVHTHPFFGLIFGLIRFWLYEFFDQSNNLETYLANFHMLCVQSVYTKIKRQKNTRDRLFLFKQVLKLENLNDSRILRDRE